MVLPWKSDWLTQKWRFFVSSHPVWSMHLKTVRIWQVRRVALVPEFPIPSMLWARWSALTTGYKYSQRRLKKQTEICRIFVEVFLKKKVLVAKLTASTFVDQWSTICKRGYAWEQWSLQKRDFPAKCCAASDKVLPGWFFSVWSSAIRLLIFVRSTWRRKFFVGLFCKNETWVLWKKDSIVRISYLCIEVNPKFKFSFRWIGTGRFCVSTALSSFVVSYTLNCVFITLSILCLAKMLSYSTGLPSTACFSAVVSSASVQSKRSKNFVRLSVASFRFNFSFRSCKLSRISVCIWVILPGISGVGNQNVLFRCSGLLVLSSSIR